MGLKHPRAGHPDGLSVTKLQLCRLCSLRRASRQNLPIFPNLGKKKKSEEYRRVIRQSPGDLLPHVSKG